MTETPKPKKLTIKQKKFVKAYVANDGNGTQAALQTYNTVDEKTAGVIAVENLAKPSIKEAIESALVKHEITMDAAIKPIADGLRATKEFGENRIEIVDHSTRLKASGMALKLLGAEKQEQSSGTNIFVNGDANFDSGKYKK
jgi:hypothetical protein